MLTNDRQSQVQQQWGFTIEIDGISFRTFLAGSSARFIIVPVCVCVRVHCSKVEHGVSIRLPSRNILTTISLGPNSVKCKNNALPNS